MHSDLIEMISFQISEIEKLFEEYDSFFQNMNYDDPSVIDKTVIGSIMHSFYNGIENIFEIIAKNIDNFVPSGNKTHKELLNNIHMDNEKRSAIIDKETYDLLMDYLGFRHFYRHSYSFHLNWEKLKPLVVNLSMTWNKAKEQIKCFMDSN